MNYCSNDNDTFAEPRQIPYRLREPAGRAVRLKSDADDFRPDHVIGNWTH